MIARQSAAQPTSLHTSGERVRMKTAHAIFGAIVAAFGVAAFVTFYDEFKPVTPWILEPSATGLCKPNLHVFAKLFENCLKRGLEAQAFSGREIGGNDDVLDFLIGHFVDVGLTGQPAS
jgi:hypothetical protein